MPWLDMSDVILDPDFADTFVVNRFTETNTGGFQVKAADGVFNNVIGSVNAASPNDLKRLPEAQVSGKVLSIVTTFRLRMSGSQGGVDFLPDEIVWHGSTYVVIWVDDYSEFGAGQIQALAESKLKQDPAPQGSPP